MDNTTSPGFGQRKNAAAGDDADIVIENCCPQTCDERSALKALERVAVGVRILLRDIRVSITVEELVEDFIVDTCTKSSQADRLRRGRRALAELSGPGVRPRCCCCLIDARLYALKIEVETPTELPPFVLSSVR